MHLDYLKIIAFKSDWRFAAANLRLRHQIRNFGLDFECYTPRSIQESSPGFFKYLKSIRDTNPNGFGLWAWKPFIINHAAQRLPDHSLLLYVDIGCDFIPTSNFINYVEAFRKSSFDLCSLPVSERTGAVARFGSEEEKWSTQSLINYLELNSRDIQSPQYRATWILVKISPHSRQLLKNWLSLIEFNDGELLREHSLAGNKLVHSRFDQSILSCLIKKSMRAGHIRISPEYSTNIGNSIWCTRNFTLYPPLKNTFSRRIQDSLFNKLLKNRH